MSDGLKLLVKVLESGAGAPLRKLKEEYFIEEEVTAYNRIRGHYRRYGQMPAVQTIEGELGIRFPSAPENFRYYFERVIDRKLYNDVYDQFGAFRRSVSQRDVEGIRSGIDALSQAARVRTIDEDLRNFREAADTVLHEYQLLHSSGRLPGVPSGWERYDARTGGYQAGDLVSMVARMGLGKTYLLLHNALSAWERGYSVLVVSMEMTIPQITRRLAGMYSGINPDFIRKGQLSTHSERRLREYVAGLANAERFNLYAGGFNKRAEDIEILIQEFTPDIVYIDGGYLLTPSVQRNMGRFERVAEVMDILKRMTITQNIPIFQTSQFSRQAGKRGKEGSLETIGFTDAIGTHSSLVLGVKEGPSPHYSTRRVIDVLKGREGEHGEFQTHYRFNPIDFSEVEVEEEENSSESADVDYMVG